MEVRKVCNKEGEQLTTKEGVGLVEHRLEAGDEVIPVFNSVLVKTHKANVKGQERDITTYSIKCRARDKDKNVITHNGEEEIFLTLTPTQGKSLQKKSEAGEQLNQNVFVAYEYESDGYGTQIGIGMKQERLPPKTFADVE